MGYAIHMLKLPWQPNNQPLEWLCGHGQFLGACYAQGTRNPDKVTCLGVYYAQGTRNPTKVTCKACLMELKAQEVEKALK